MRKLIFLMLACIAWLPATSHAQDYREVRIVAPENDTMIHDNNGNLAIEVTLAPALAAGDQLTLLLDDKAVAQGRKLSFELKNIDRGSHKLQVRVASANGKALAASPPVVFHMWRASLLFKHPQQAK